MGKSDDDEARRRWFRHEVLPLEPQLRRHALRIASGNAQDAEDLVHDAFLRILGTSGWRAIDNPAAFAVRILQNLGIDSIRRRKIVAIDAFADLHSLNIADDLPGPEESASRQNDQRLLSQAIAALPAQCRRVMTMRKVEDLSHKEISSRLGISVSTVEKHLARGLRFCSARLSQRDRDIVHTKEDSTWQTPAPLNAKK